MSEQHNVVAVSDSLSRNEVRHDASLMVIALTVTEEQMNPNCYTCGEAFDTFNYDDPADDHIPVRDWMYIGSGQRCHSECLGKRPGTPRSRVEE